METTLNMYDYANIFNTYEDENGLTFFNLMNSLNIEGEIDASLYTYDLAYSFTSWYELSNKHYGTPRLWWIILLANNVKNPFEIPAGLKVKILKGAVVTEIVSQINNSNARRS